MNNISQSRLLELIKAVFTGVEITGEVESYYKFSNDFQPAAQLTDKSAYLELKQSEFNFKYNFLFTLTETISELANGLSSTSDRDYLINTVHRWFQDIAKHPDSMVKIRKHNNTIVSILLGTFIPLTAGITSYDFWGIPEDAPIFSELTDLNLEAPTFEQLTSHCEDYGVIVVSRNYLRVGAIELCGDKFNMLLNTQNKQLFTVNEHRSYSHRLHDIVSICQASTLQVNSLFERPDKVVTDTGGWWTSARNKLCHLVVTDEVAFKNILGYVRVQITTDENSLGRKIESLKADEDTEWLYRSTAFCNKAKLIKNDRYAIAAESSDGILFALEKTSKHREIRKKTENTKVFRADLIESLFNQISCLILGDELNSKNIEPHQTYCPFSKDQLEDFHYYYKHSSSAPQTILAAGPEVFSQWVMTRLDAALAVIEPKFKSRLTSRTEDVFEDNSRFHFFTNLMKFEPNYTAAQGFVSQDLYRSCCVLHGKVDGRRILSYNDKSTISIQLRNVFRIFDPSVSKYSRHTTLCFDRLDQITNFYLDNFIPQIETETMLGELTTRLADTWDSRGKNSIQSYYIPESDILIEEVISISSEAVSLMKAMASIKTYSELKSWWSFAKMHLLIKTGPSLQSKLPQLAAEMLKLNLHSFVKHVDWTMQVLETSEASYLPLED